MLLMIPGIPMMNAQKTRKANSACHGRGEVKTPGELSVSLMSAMMLMLLSLLTTIRRLLLFFTAAARRPRESHLAQLLLFSV